MLAVAADRVAAAGWSNVVLIDSPLETAELPDQVDHALFCAVHDVMQSVAALDHVLGRLRPGGGVAAGGGKWGPAWAIGMNAGVLALHAPYVRDFAGFDRPWTHLGERGCRACGAGGGDGRRLRRVRPEVAPSVDTASAEWDTSAAVASAAVMMAP